MAGCYGARGGRNITFAADTSGRPYVGIGHSGGVAAENWNHASAMSPGTDYGVAFSLDGVSKNLKIYLYTYSGSLNQVGTDIDQSVLSSSTWNYAESDLIIGFWEAPGVKRDNWILNGELKYLQVANTVFFETTIESILTRELGGVAPPAAPTIIDIK
jgi:hypothetical protein